jgi:proline racemase
MTHYPQVIETVDMHTGGEPLRIVTAGWPDVAGATILDKRRYSRENLDHLRRLIICEPRGHKDMYAAVFVRPDQPKADFAVLFLHNEGYSTMCGHAVIALGRYAVDHGLVKLVAPRTRVAMQVPCGLIEAEVDVADGPEGRRGGAVSFVSVPCFAHALDLEVEVASHGRVTLDVAYGGAFYAVLPAARLGLDLGMGLSDLVEAADRVTAAVRAAHRLDHPDDAELAYLYGTILTDGGTGRDRPTRNLCVFADREVDRSPTGSGVSARMALAAARGEAAEGEEHRFESITRAIFSAAIVADCAVGARPAVRVRVGGTAHYTGTCRFTHEPGDDLGKGFVLR